MSGPATGVYIVASKPYRTLYIGVTKTCSVASRHIAKGSARDRRAGMVYDEPFADIEAAIQREKALKH